MTDLDLTGKRVLIRADLNVPIEGKKISSMKRIDAILPTLQIALEQGAKIILMSHLGRPKEGIYDSAFSLAPVALALEQKLHRKVTLIQDMDSPFTVEPGKIILLENTRFLVGEKENSPVLARKFAELADVFVMDAFATAHRKEASTYGVAEYIQTACAGPLLMAEMDAMQQILKNPARPLVAIVGGSKISTKLAVLKNILEKVDYLIVGGGIANTFLVAQGFSVGKSLYEPDLVEKAKQMITFAKENHKYIPLPEDVVVAKEFSSSAEAITLPVNKLCQEFILDVGPKSIEKLKDIISKAKTILWNGPLGVFEWDQFAQGTKSIAEAIATSPAYTVAGGGDTIAAIEKYHLESSISYISTGGGAFLEVLEGKKLPAIAILEQRCQKNTISVN